MLQILGAVLLPVTSPFAVESLSLRLRTRLGLLHLSSNLLSVLLEVPLLPFALFCSDPPQTVKSLCISVIPGSLMLTHTILED